MKKKYYYIYKTTNLLSGKYYLGMHSTFNLEDGYLGSGKRLWYSIRKYGKENHKKEILEFVKNWEDLKKREEEIITLNEIAKKECMNLRVGGKGGFTSEEAKLGRIATNKILKEKYGDSFQQTISKRFQKSLKEDKIKQQIFSEKIKLGQIKVGFKHDTFKNKKHTEETKLKQSLARKGKYNGSKHPHYGTCWIYNLELKMNKKIKKRELVNFLSSDWKAGRKMRF